jgi:hypothetical protein
LGKKVLVPLTWGMISGCSLLMAPPELWGSGVVSP